MAILHKPEYFWPALWIGAAVALSAILALEYFFGGVEVGMGPRAPAKIVEAKLLPPFTLPAEAPAGSETVARPLFVPTRRPSPPVASAATPAIRRGQFVLTGVSIAPEMAFAFLRESATGKTHSVKMGATVNGMTVDRVEPRRVVLRLGEEIEDLTLNTLAPARVASTPAPTGAVPPAPGSSVAASAPQLTPTPPGSVPAAPPGLSDAATSAVQPGAAPAAPGTPAPPSGRRRLWINAQ